MVWRLDDPQGNEAGKIKYVVVPYVRGRGLDIGCGPHKAFEYMTGVDSCKDTALFGIDMAPDVTIEDATRLSMFPDASQDYVFSSHLLEHIEDWRAALREWWRVIKPGGHLVLYLPHKDLYPNVGTPGANPDHKHDFLPADIRTEMLAVAQEAGTTYASMLDEERAEGTEYSFLQVFRKEVGREDFQLLHLRPKQPTACVVRYGGFGDMIQAANVLPALKRAGYHVTVMTTPRGQDILREDPHVDAWFIQDENQVPNRELVEFWTEQAKRFDRFINLSESIEGTLLSIPGRANFYWPDAVRRRECAKNYLEWTSELAGVPYDSEARFYPTDAEEREACDRLALAGGGFSIVFALAGSSVHKFWPHQDALIARIMIELPEARVFLVGDHACKILEQGWEHEPRVVRLSGELSIRETLTLATVADMVIGPETGVLNAVAFAPDVAKIVMLSHSSPENLTKHWPNTTPLSPIFSDGIACYPCHRLHYGSTHCNTDPDTGAALCQRAITPDRAYHAVEVAYETWAAN